MTEREVVAIIFFGAVALCAVTAGVLTLVHLVKSIFRRNPRPPVVARRITVDAPKTRPLIAGQWERSIKKDD
jgi:hypothetical protein